ncbi:MAG TPA: hypothetical protein VF534_01915 [Paraburkholderia sp.]
MSEPLILAAIVAPLVLVPLIIISLQQAVDPDCHPNAGAVFLMHDFELPDAESPFDEFQRAMLAQICAMFA